MRQSLFLTVMLALVFCGSAAVNAQQDQGAGPWQTYDTSNGEWRSYAGDVGGKKILAARPDRRKQLRGPGDRLGVDLGGPLRQPVYARRRRVAGPARHRGRHADRGHPGSLPARTPATPVAPAGDAADGGRGALLQHAAVAGRGGRRDHRRDAVGLQPEGLRGGDADDEQPVVAAGGRVLDRRRRGRAHLLGHRQRLPDLRRRADRAAVPRLRPRRRRTGRRDGRAARGPTATNATT